MGPNLDRDEIAHAAGGNEQRGLLAEDFSGSTLERIDGWVFQINIVANFGFSHRAAHGGRRTRDRVAAKVNNVGFCSGGLQFAFWIGHGLSAHAAFSQVYSSAGWRISSTKASLEMLKCRGASRAIEPERSIKPK